MDDQLPAISPGLWHHCAGFAPNQLGPARAKPLETAEREFSRLAIRGGIATFHRLDCQPIADPAPMDMKRGPERIQGRVELQAEVQLGGGIADRLDRLEFEESRHQSGFRKAWVRCVWAGTFNPRPGHVPVA